MHYLEFSVCVVFGEEKLLPELLVRLNDIKMVNLFFLFAILEQFKHKFPFMKT